MNLAETEEFFKKFALPFFLLALSYIILPLFPGDIPLHFLDGMVKGLYLVLVIAAIFFTIHLIIHYRRAKLLKQIRIE